MTSRDDKIVDLQKFMNSSPRLRSQSQSQKKKLRDINISNAKHLFRRFLQLWKISFQHDLGEDYEAVFYEWAHALIPYDFKQIDRAIDNVRDDPHRPGKDFAPKIATFLEYCEKVANVPKHMMIDWDRAQKIADEKLKERFNLRRTLAADNRAAIWAAIEFERTIFPSLAHAIFEFQSMHHDVEICNVLTCHNFKHVEFRHSKPWLCDNCSSNRVT